MFLWCYDARPYPFWPSLNKIWRDSEMWAYGHWVNGKFGDTNLKAIISSLCRKAGLENHQYDCSLLNYNVEGYVLADYITARAAIEILASVYFFHLVEADGKLKFIPSDIGDTGLIINQSEFVDNSDKKIYQINKEQTINMPASVDILFLDKLQNYKQGFEVAKMTYSAGKENITINLPMVFSSNSVKQIAKKILYNRWQNSLSFSFSLSTKYSYLEPGDIITLNINNNYYKIIIYEICYAGFVNILKIDAHSLNASIYNDFPSEVNIPNIEVIKNNQQIIIYVIELSNSINHSVFIAIASLSMNDNFLPIYGSKNQGNSYEFLANIKPNNIIGTAINALNKAYMQVIDYYSILEIILISGELESIDDFTFGDNLALIGSEIIQFTKAILVKDHHYQLSGIIRGCFGTEIFINYHVDGEKFILLNNDLIEIPASLNEMTKYKIADQEIDHIYTGSNIKSHAVVNIRVVKNPEGDLLISWCRKSRLNYNNWDNEVPLLEIAEKYEVDIIKNNSIIRTICINEPFLIYNKDLIFIDFNNNLDGLSFIIYQKSDLVGRGFGAEFIYRE